MIRASAPSASRLLLALALAVPLALAAPRVRADEGAWALCGGGVAVPARPPFEGEPGAGDTVQIAADRADLNRGGISRLEGDVQVVRGTSQLQADVVVHDEVKQTLDASGNVRLWDEGLFVTGDHADRDLESGISTVDRGTYVVEDAHGHGTADRVVLRPDDVLVAEHGTFTTCDPPDPAWILSASHVELDRPADVGTARNVVLRFQGVPIFYSPYMSFPLSDARKSGFLTPRVRISGEAGPEITTPYYFNLAPNRDATIGMRAMANRGAQFQGEYRYLTPRGSGELNLETLPHDIRANDARNLLHFQHRGSFAPGWNGYANFDWVSDRRYFEDLGTELAVSSHTFLERRAEVTRRVGDWSATARVQAFQTVDTTLPPTSRPYQRLPQFRVSYAPVERNRQPNLGLTAEAVYFDRNASVTGGRVDLRPSVSLPMRTAGTFLVPRAELRYTGYSLSGTAAGVDDSPSRLLPVLSVDSGLFLERDLELGGRDLVQTLEPRMYYLLIPYDDQSDFPVFDTGSYTFNFAQLFRDNRFNGTDRVGEANQVALSLTSRLLSRSGRELGRVSVGQIRYLRDRKVTLPGVAAQTTRSSSYVGNLLVRPTPDWNISAGLQWDPRDERADTSTLAVRYLPDARRVINATYRFVRGTSEQTDWSFAWPLRRNWRAVGRWFYALPERQLLEGLAGVEYESCCWGLRVLARRYLSDASGNHSSAMFVELQLKGLAGLGSKALSFLQTSIPGYQREF